MSNLDTEKQVMQERAAKLGNVGIRVHAKRGPTPEDSRVFLTFDHPAKILDYDDDTQGNITSILLEYTRIEGPLGEDREEHVYREWLTKESFRVERDGEAFGEVVPNLLGVCPYVLLFHRTGGGEWGRPAHHGAETVVHEINALIARHKRLMHRHSYPKWFATGSGPEPDTISFGEEKVLYARQGGDDVTPRLVPMVTELQHTEIRQFWLELIKLLGERQPELMLYQLRALSGMSGETIAQLLKPTETVIELAKRHYEHVLVRAVQIALSWGVLLRKWDLGTGMGSPANAERAFRTGRENFAFDPRPSLPQSAIRPDQGGGGEARGPRGGLQARAGGGRHRRRRGETEALQVRRRRGEADRQAQARAGRRPRNGPLTTENTAMATRKVKKPGLVQDVRDILANMGIDDTTLTALPTHETGLGQTLRLNVLREERERDRAGRVEPGRDGLPHLGDAGDERAADRARGANNTKTDTALFEVVLPWQYKAGTDLTLTVHAGYTLSAGTTVTATVDASVYEMVDKAGNGHDRPVRDGGDRDHDHGGRQGVHDHRHKSVAERPAADLGDDERRRGRQHGDGDREGLLGPAVVASTWNPRTTESRARRSDGARASAAAAGGGVEQRRQRAAARHERDLNHGVQA